jgi:tetratricopeptide (TPR) repeat protein
MPRHSTERKGFGIFLGSIRDSLNKEDQVAFAKRLHVSRSLIANVETGTPSSPAFIETLIATFPNRQAEIEEAALRHRKPPSPRSRRRKHSPTHQHISAQITAGELKEALHALIYTPETALVASERIWPLVRLSRAFDRNQNIKNRDSALDWASIFAKDKSVSTRVKIGLAEEHVVCFCRNKQHGKALDYLDSALARYPAAGRLWYRKGYIHWVEEDFVDAHAALTMALKYKGPRLDILYIRGQVFVEWRRFEEAISDLNEALTNEQLDPSWIVRALSVRAYALYWEWDLAQAFAEFTSAIEFMPESIWPFYYRAICNDDLSFELLVFGTAEKQLEHEAQMRADLEHVLKNKISRNVLGEARLKDVRRMAGLDEEIGQESKTCHSRNNII